MMTTSADTLNQETVEGTLHRLAEQHKRGEIEFVQGKRKILEALPPSPEQQGELFRMLVRERAASLIDTKALASKHLDAYHAEAPVREAMARILEKGKRSLLPCKESTEEQRAQPTAGRS